MRAIMLMFDTLRRDMLPNYNKNIKNMPNFKRLEMHSVKFNNFYAGSLPCMPARRELHTGRLNFLHRSWSPLEPFDDSIFEIMKNNNIYSHLITDHQHYWEDGGATYHNRYSSYEFVRGQEGDLWKADLNFKEHVKLNKYNIAEKFRKNMVYHDEVNRSYMRNEEDYPQAKCVQLGIEFIDKNHNCDNWYLQIENFDPHEPFYVPNRFKEMVDTSLIDSEYDWPEYTYVDDIDDNDKLIKWKKNYLALMYMCDEYLGKILDKLDEYNMWEDTMLIVNTDHGFLFGEKEWSGKSVMPVYNELAHTPFFIWDPNSKLKNKEIDELAQTPDIALTLLKHFNLEKTKDMTGKPIQNILNNNQKNHNEILFGYFGGHICITDSKYVYMRGSKNIDNEPLYEYTLMPTRMRRRFDISDFNNVELSEPLSFTKGMKILKVKSKSEFYTSYSHGNLLFDLVSDPNQEHSILDYDKEKEFINKLIKKLSENDAPKDEYIRLGLDVNKTFTYENVKTERFEREENLKHILQGFYNKNLKINIKTLLLNIAYQTSEEYMLELFEILKDIDDISKIDIFNAYRKLDKFYNLNYLFQIKY